MNEQTDILDQVQQAQKPSELTVIASKINQGLEAFAKRKSDLISLKSECENLSIESVEDKQNIALVSNYRKKLKGERVTIEKEGKSMRDPLTQIARTISEKENELILIIEPTEKLLLSKENWVKTETARVDLEKQQAEEKVKREKIQSRIDRLAPYGATIDIVYLETLPDDHFEKVVVNAAAQFEINQARIAEEKRIAEEAAAQLKRDQEELAALRKSQADAQRIIDQENERIYQETLKIAAQKDILEAQKNEARFHKLQSLGMVRNSTGFYFGNATYKIGEVVTDSQEVFEAAFIHCKSIIDEEIKELENRRLADLKKSNDHAITKALSDKAEADKQKAIAEEEKLNASSDKIKFQAVAATLVSIKIPAMKSKKMMKLHEEVRGKIDAIVEYINANT